MSLLGLLSKELSCTLPFSSSLSALQGGGVHLKPKPMFVIFFPLGQQCQEEQAPEHVRWREGGRSFLMVEANSWGQSCCAAAGGLQHGVFAKHEAPVSLSLLGSMGWTIDDDGWDLIQNNFNVPFIGGMELKIWRCYQVAQEETLGKIQKYCKYPLKKKLSIITFINMSVD